MSAVQSDMQLGDEPDHLAGALLRSFSNKAGSRRSWSFIKTLLWSTVTFGIWPLHAWPAALRDLIAAERQQFQHLGEWMRLRSGHPQSGALVDAANRIKPIAVLSYGPMLLGAFVAAIMISSLARLNFPDGMLLASTYQFGRLYVHPTQVNELFFIWTVGLTTAYTMHWFQLLAHASNVRRAVRVFNKLAASEGLPPVRSPRGIGLRPVWLAAALVMMSASAIWAIPMMLAGGMQRRYAAVTGPALRAAVADRLRDLLLIRRPVMRVPRAVSMNRICPNESCRSPIARIANFCPRCGKHVGPDIDALA